MAEVENRYLDFPVCADDSRENIGCLHQAECMEKDYAGF